MLAHRETGPDDDQAEFPRTSKRKEPYVARMRTLGKDMYTLIGVPKGDQAAAWRQWGRNYQFFDAPVGLIFTIDKDLDAMSFLDTGMFVLAIMLAAKARGLDTCAQGAWNSYWTVTRRVLDVPDDQYIVCGVSLGWADPSAPVNSLRSEREPVEAFTTFTAFRLPSLARRGEGPNNPSLLAFELDVDDRVRSVRSSPAAGHSRWAEFGVRFDAHARRAEALAGPDELDMEGQGPRLAHQGELPIDIAVGGVDRPKSGGDEARLGESSLI